MSRLNRCALLTCLLVLGILVTLLPLSRPLGVTYEKSALSMRMGGLGPALPGSSRNLGSRKRNQTTPVSSMRAADAVLQSVSIEAVDTPVREILESFREHHSIEIWIDQIALGDQTELLDKEVSVTANDVPLSWVLDRLLLPLKLEWLTDGDALRITTQAVAQNHLEVRVYDVLDLNQSGFDSDTLVEIVEACVEPEAWASTKAARLLASHQPDPAAAVGNEKKSPHQSLPNADSHDAGSGPNGRIRVHEGVLVVWQTQRVHMQIEHFLDQIETLLEDAEEDRRFKEPVVTVKRKQSNRARDKSLRQTRRFFHQ